MFKFRTHHQICCFETFDIHTVYSSNALDYKFSKWRQNYELYWQKSIEHVGENKRNLLLTAVWHRTLPQNAVSVCPVGPKRTPLHIRLHFFWNIHVLSDIISKIQRNSHAYKPHQSHDRLSKITIHTSGRTRWLAATRHVTTYIHQT